MKTTTQVRKPTKATARKVLEVVNAGLVSGVGEPTPGKMCVEAAVCFALGEPHGDQPSCVGVAVRAFKIRLNDTAWSSNEARTNGMREIAIAQLGSNEINQREFADRVVIGSINKFLPIALRAAASTIPRYAVELEAVAKVCEFVTDMISARKAAEDACALTKTVRADAAAADAVYAAYAADAADAVYAAYAADAAAAAAAYAAADAVYAAYAADAADAVYAAYAADAVYAAYAAYAAARGTKRDSILAQVADMGVAILKEMKCPGTKWLGLLEEGPK